VSPIETLVSRILAGVLADGTEVDNPTTHFADLGLDSLTGLRFARRLGDALGSDIEPEWLYDYPSVQALSAHLSALGFSGASAVDSAEPA
jgi:acyl carrier protein